MPGVKIEYRNLVDGLKWVAVKRQPERAVFRVFLQALNPA